MLRTFLATSFVVLPPAENFHLAATLTSSIPLAYKLFRKGCGAILVLTCPLPPKNPLLKARKIDSDFLRIRFNSSPVCCTSPLLGTVFFLSKLLPKNLPESPFCSTFLLDGVTCPVLFSSDLPSSNKFSNRHEPNSNGPDSCNVSTRNCRCNGCNLGPLPKKMTLS